MLTIQQVRNLHEATVYDADGNKIGKVGQIYLDDQTGQPEWVAVRTGLFGTHESFIPLAHADISNEGELVVPVSKAEIKDAPRIDPVGGHLSEADEVELYRYYGLAPEPSGQGGGPVGRDISGPTTDDAMTRSEERLRVGVEQHETGRVRLRKYVVTEEVQQPVQISHEEVRVEHEPITAENRDRAMSGAEISEEEHEVTLHAERPVVQTEVTPVERVRLTKNTVRDQETVHGKVRKEQIETETVDERNRTM